MQEILKKLTKTLQVTKYFLFDLKLINFFILQYIPLT